MPLTDAEVLANLLEWAHDPWHGAIAMYAFWQDHDSEAQHWGDEAALIIRICRAWAEDRRLLADMVVLAEHYTDPGITTPETYARIDEAKRRLKGVDDGNCFSLHQEG